MFRPFLPAWLWAALILFLTLTPGQYLPKVDYWSITSIDKYIHFFIFFVQVWLLLWGAGQKRPVLLLPHYIVPVCMGILFGILIEYIQIMIPHRSFDIQDMIANSIGAVLGAFIFRLASKK
jgi:VanZ family protein